jgi:hypothetical protein
LAWARVAAAGEAEFADQAVLRGAPGALDAAFGLGRVGRDLLDAELVEGASEWGGRLFSDELFGHGPVRVVALEDDVAVAVEAERNAGGEDHGAQGEQIARILGFGLEVGGENFVGGVVLKADQGEFGPAVFELVMTAGVAKRHHAETRAGRAPGAVLAWGALLRGGQLGGAQNASHGLAAEPETFLGAKFFGEVRIVEAHILAAGQG